MVPFPGTAPYFVFTSDSFPLPLDVEHPREALDFLRTIASPKHRSRSVNEKARSRRARTRRSRRRRDGPPTTSSRSKRKAPRDLRALPTVFPAMSEQVSERTLSKHHSGETPSERRRSVRGHAARLPGRRTPAQPVATAARERCGAPGAMSRSSLVSRLAAAVLAVGGQSGALLRGRAFAGAPEHEHGGGGTLRRGPRRRPRAHARGEVARGSRRNGAVSGRRVSPRHSFGLCSMARGGDAHPSDAARHGRARR